jgi:hypothetical protein
MEIVKWKFLRKLSSGNLINVYKFPLDDFHPSNPSDIVHLSEMPQES